MTISPFYVYLWGQVESIASFMNGLGWIIFILALFIGFVTMLSSTDIAKQEGGEKMLSVLLSVTLGLVVVSGGVWGVEALIPNKKTMAAMFIVPAIVNSKPIQQDLPEIYNLAMQKLKEELSSVVKPEETKPEAPKTEQK